jgi:hypothetical protein
VPKILKGEVTFEGIKINGLIYADDIDMQSSSLVYIQID